MNWNIIKIRFKRLDLVKDKLKKINASYLEVARDVSSRAYQLTTKRSNREKPV